MVGIPRQYSNETVHYLRRNFTFADRGVAKVIGTIPAGSVILKPTSGLNVSTVFNGTGTDLFSIGYVDASGSSANRYATAIDVSALGFTALNQAVSEYVAVDTDITGTYSDANSDATTGAAQAVIAYIPFSNDSLQP